MSHQTGIKANDHLKQFITKCKQNDSVRVMKVAIRDEELVLDGHHEPVDKWQTDYTKFVTGMILDRQPCYLMFRLDSLNVAGQYEWLFILWSPENSPVREKMMYASTKATMKTEFGGGSIKTDYFASTKDEISLASYLNDLQRKKSMPEGEDDQSLLTEQEKDLRKVKQDEAISSCISKQNRTLPGLQIPITDDAINALHEFRDGLISYIQLSIDWTSEVIKLEVKESPGEFDISSLPSKFPENKARYHLLIYPHNYDGVSFRSVIFIYSVPGVGIGSQCSVKERMMYSSCKLGLLNVIQQDVGIEIEKKLEMDDHEDLTEDFFLNELHPKENIVKTKFDKPKGPAGKRGAKRLIKPE